MASEQYLRPPHPRRPQAHHSVSLLHRNGRSPPQSKSSLNSRSTQTNSTNSSLSSTRPLVSKDSSGESSNADKWFDSSNNNASRSRGTMVDNDPPFFLQHSSSEETPNDGTPGPSPPLGNHMSIMYGIPMAGTEGSGSSDFRAVIDDLTVENKKLRRRLKKYEKLHDAHLKDEKLFEVRVHGLPSEKKRELEELLRKFALGTNDQEIANVNTNAMGSGSSHAYDAVPVMKTHKTASSSNFADSAYASASASASASGQGSALSNSNSGQPRPPFRRSAKASNNNIQSYLHDIPEGLLPQHPSAMTEHTKKKLVVRRLEQIFAGTGIDGNDHQHPLQQQEVSQLAAKADRTAEEASGKPLTTEGNREARIMREQSEDSNSGSDQSPERKLNGEDPHILEPSEKISEQDSGAAAVDDASPEQRPTRPLDLDPHRAQNAFDNIDYLRHLGFSPPGAASLDKSVEGHGWIYLNFLINMAQLHTLNVTSDFVKKAVEEHSSQFELSTDGRKVRWRGGRALTRTSSDGGETTPSDRSWTPRSLHPKKRVKSSHHTKNGIRRVKQRLLEKQDNKLVYNPLFFHRSDDSSDNSSSEDDDIEASFVAPVAGKSMGMNSSGVRTVSAKRNRKRDNGPMIFYSNSRFCTDLSGDQNTESAMDFNPILYHVATKQPIGVAQEQKKQERAVLESRGPLHTAEHLPEAMELDDNPIPENLEVNFPGRTPLSDSSGSSGFCKSPMEMQASGIGGICPADNFSINVRTQRKSTEKLSSRTVRTQLRKSYPIHIANLLKGNSHGARPEHAIQENILRASHRQLPPSELPPASCFPDVSESEEDDSDDESCVSISRDVSSAHVPYAALQAIDMHYLSSDDSDVEDEDGDEDGYGSDGSLDLLATAREIDPETVRAREREYDANVAERLAEEIPAGSSAATAGGGSGFASPASGVDEDEYRAARAQHRAKQASAGASVPSSLRAHSDSTIVSGRSL